MEGLKNPGNLGGWFRVRVRLRGSGATLGPGLKKKQGKIINFLKVKTVNK